MNLNASRLLMLCFMLVFCFRVAAAQGPTDFGKGLWELVSIKDKDGRQVTQPGRGRYSIYFDNEGRFEANLECNVGRATFTSASAGQIKIGPMALTHALCPRGPFYDRIVRDFQNFHSYAKAGDGKLVLTTVDGSVYEFAPSPGATLDPDSPRSLYGVMWQLKQINDTQVGETNAYLEFDQKNGSFSGDGGCNRISGNVAVNGQNIRFTNAISTRRACVDTRLQEIENSFFRNLTEVTQFELRNGLILKADGRQVLFLSTERIHPKGELSVTVTYAERKALPRSAVIEVKLLEVAPVGPGQAPVLPDDNADGVAYESLDAAGRQVPFRVKLSYDPYAVDPLLHYVVRARIIANHRLMLNTSDWYRVITFGNPDSVDVVVKPPRR